MKTAVEWLLSNVSLSVDAWIEIEKYEAKAKQMEKEQIEKALLTGLVYWDVDKPIEQYYNETFKNKKK